jgi:hypothetical protein
MAILISIRLLTENQEVAIYEYQTGDRSPRKARLIKSTGDVIPEAEDQLADEDLKLFARVSYKLRKHWTEGEVPKITSWSS